MPDFGAYQNEIYLAGLSGRLPRFPFPQPGNTSIPAFALPSLAPPKDFFPRTMEFR